jgi:hypothetical protein
MSDACDADKFEIYRQAPNMHMVLWDLSQELRKIAKYENIGEDEQALIERVREVFYMIVKANNVDLEL